MIKIYAQQPLHYREKALRAIEASMGHYARVPTNRLVYRCVTGHIDKLIVARDHGYYISLNDREIINDLIRFLDNVREDGLGEEYLRLQEYAHLL